MKFLSDHAHQKLSFDLTPLIPYALAVVIFVMFTFHNPSGSVPPASRRKLPGELARPVWETPLRPVVLQLTDKNTVIVGGDEVSMPAVKPLLARERSAQGCQYPWPVHPCGDHRAGPNAPAGKVQELILIAQQTGFQRFILRAKEEPGSGSRSPSSEGS